MLEILDGIIATGAVILALSLIVQAIQQIKTIVGLKQTLRAKGGESGYLEAFVSVRVT